MKKIYLFASMVVGLTLSAQQNKQTSAQLGGAIPKAQNIVASISTATTTALIPSSFTNTMCSLYSAIATETTGLGGYIGGNNQYDDKEKAMKYSLSANTLGLPATVNSVALFIGTKKAGGPGTGLLSVKVYADNAGAPGTLLGTSDTRTISTLTAGTYTSNIFTFTTPVALTSNDFYVSVDFTGAGADTLSLAQTFNCSAITNTTTSWEMASTNAWAKIKSSWGATAEFGIFPLVGAEYALAVKNVAKDLTLSSAFPNPAVNELSINFGLNQSSKVEIEVYDVTGKLVNTVKLDQLEAGNHTTKLDVANLNSGIYMYSVKANTTKLFSKFTLVK